MAGSERAHDAREQGRGLTTDWPWQRLAESNASSHDLLVELLDPQPGERFLDVGTGSGGVAARAAARGAASVGIDIAPAAIESAQRAHPDVRFEVAAAEQLPFDDASFDVVASAYGVNFAPDHAAAAAELGRVCRKGGRLGLAVMPPGTAAAAVWSLVREYRARGDHPAAWTAGLLEPWFDVEVRRRESARDEQFTPEERWEFARTEMGFVRAVVEELDDEDVERFRDAFLDVARRYADAPVRSTVILGTRK